MPRYEQLTPLVPCLTHGRPTIFFGFAIVPATLGRATRDGRTVH